MASIKLRGDTSGELVIEAPAVAGTNTLTLPADTANILTDNSSLPAANLTGSLPAGMGGKILQVQSTKMGSAFTTSSTNTWVDITGFSVNITPSSTSSKILIMFDTQLSSDFAGFRIMRNSTEVGSGDVAGSRITASSGGFRPMTGDRVMNVSQVHLDSPATTSAITYKIQTRCNTSGTTYINRTSSWGDSTVYFTNASNITVMEVAG
jgi:hypothetical protein